MYITLSLSLPAKRLTRTCPNARDIKSHPNELEGALKGADLVFCSLVFDFDQVMIPARWLTPSAVD
jgi:hypothetical protein